MSTHRHVVLASVAAAAAAHRLRSRGRLAWRPLALCATALALRLAGGGAAPALAQHSGDLLIGSTAEGGGALAISHPFPLAIPVAPSFQAGGVTLYSATDPGFDASSGGGLFRLSDGTAVSAEIVSTSGCPAGSPGCVSLKVGTSTLDAPGETGPIGVMPDLHDHPAWQLTLPDGVVGSFGIAFRLVAGRGYGPSPTYTATLTNGSPEPTPRPPVPLLPEAAIDGPAGQGDQLAFYFDAREGFTTFVNLSNAGDAPLEVRVRFHAADLASAVERTEHLPARGTRTISLDAVVAAGLPRQAGLATAAAVDGTGAAIVTRALSGSFTIANLGTLSAWGAPAAARRAVRLGGGQPVEPELGARIDGQQIVLRQIHPEALDLAVYYDPLDLEPAAIGGNQLVFVSFADIVGDGLGAAAATTSWAVEASRSDGSPLPAAAHPARGVSLSDLASVAGAGVEGAAGRIRFRAGETEAPNRWIYFVESLGTFATGYALPSVRP